MYYTEREGRGWKGYVFIFTDCVGFRWFSANAAGRAFISPFKRSDKSNQSSVSLVRLNPASLASQDYSSRRTTLSLFRSPPFHSILRHEQPVTFSLFSSMELIEYFFLFILPFLYILFFQILCIVEEIDVHSGFFLRSYEFLFTTRARILETERFQADFRQKIFAKRSATSSTRIYISETGK